MTPPHLQIIYLIVISHFTQPQNLLFFVLNVPPWECHQMLFKKWDRALNFILQFRDLVWFHCMCHLFRVLRREASNGGFLAVTWEPPWSWPWSLVEEYATEEGLSEVSYYPSPLEFISKSKENTEAGEHLWAGEIGNFQGPIYWLRNSGAESETQDQAFGVWSPTQEGI